MNAIARLRIPDNSNWSLDLGPVEGEPWAQAMMESTQDPVLHAEGNVWVHTEMVISSLVADPAWRDLDSQSKQALFWAALFHDVAKPQTRILEDGHIRNPRHSRIGSLEARVMLWQAGVDREVREAACAIIAVHQAPFYLLERPQWQAERLLCSLALGVEPAYAATHARADTLGRICPDQQKMLDSIGMFSLMAEEMEAHKPGTHMFTNDHARVRYFADPERLDWRCAPPDITSSAFEVVVLSGMPGSGKSTVAARLSEGGMPIISLDKMREELGVGQGDNQGTMLQLATERAREHLRAKRSFVWDSTNLTRDQRGRVLGLAHAYGARSRVLSVERTWGETMQGNEERDTQVPQAVMDRMLRKWEPPTLSECHALEIIQPEAHLHRTLRM